MLRASSHIPRRRRSAAPRFVNRFRLPGRRLFLGKARLFEDRIVLKGWGLSGRYHHTLWLHEVDRVEWWTGSPFSNLELVLKDGSSFWMWVEGAGRWKFAIDRGPASGLVMAPALPGQVPARAA
ncbi:MAG: hypothetical protein KatS3mg042_0431 [Rhodothermaceae bacterium]|nr:MAG: hypothetical protein KatS3mg042_0431 [Rhodothermaceae bacterium]